MTSPPDDPRASSPPAGAPPPAPTPPHAQPPTVPHGETVPHGGGPHGERSEQPPEKGRGDRTWDISAGQIVAAILFVIVIVFVVENTRTVRVRLLFPEVRAPLAVALLIAAVLGALVVSLMRVRRQRRRARRQKQQQH